MHAHLFDPFISTGSPVHALDSRIKLALALLFLLSVALTPHGVWAALILDFATLQAAVILSGLSPLRMLRRSGIALPFVLAAFPLLFTTPGSPLISFSLGQWVLTPTGEGLLRFLSIALKSWISVQAALLLSATTPFPDLLLAMRAFHVPQMLVSVTGLMWRYLFVLADEAIRLIRARDARSGAEPGRRPGGGVLWRARVTGGMAGSLFVRGFDRADRVYAAMLARGYDGETRALPAPPAAPAQYLVLAAGGAWILLIALLAILIR
jgi:cobalt/nickel transport system permease protein